jgi:hypothetical protein
MFTAAWTSAFLLNFAINMAVPAMSPRIYLEARFQHPIEGLSSEHRDLNIVSFCIVRVISGECSPRKIGKIEFLS